MYQLTESSKIARFKYLRSAKMSCCAALLEMGRNFCRHPTANGANSKLLLLRTLSTEQLNKCYKRTDWGIISFRLLFTVALVRF